MGLLGRRPSTLNPAQLHEKRERFLGRVVAQEDELISLRTELMEMKMTALCQVMPVNWREAISQVRYRRACSLLGLLLTPIAVAAGAVAAWRFGVDAGWTHAFFIANGALSNWEVWCAFGISTQAAAYLLKRAAPCVVQATS